MLKAAGEPSIQFMLCFSANTRDKRVYTYIYMYISVYAYIYIYISVKKSINSEALDGIFTSKS